MKRLEIELDAQVEYFEAALQYDSEVQGLGFRFQAEVEQTCRRIEENPRAYTEVAPGFRRALVHVFPYGVTYYETEELILVVSILHLHRDPDTWIKRTKRD